MIMHVGSVSQSSPPIYDPVDYTAYQVHQTPLSMGFPSQEYWSRLPFPSPGESSWLRDWTCISYIGKWILYHWAIWEALKMTIQTAYKHMKISLTSLVIQVIQMKTTIRYYFTPTRVAGKKKYWCEFGEIGVLLHCWLESKIVKLHWRKFGNSSKCSI